MRGQGADTRHIGQSICSHFASPWPHVRSVLGTWEFPHPLRQFEIHVGHQMLTEPI
jgi:hypothetical protein